MTSRGIQICYGCDDMDCLIQTSRRPDTVKVTTRGRTYRIPVGRFDKRLDKTSFMRKDRANWPAASVHSLHGGLVGAWRASWRQAPR